MRTTVVCLLGFGALLAILLAAGQRPFAPSKFEFGVFRIYNGIAEQTPVPSMISGGERYLLVGPGKRGATEMAPPGRALPVELQGSLIERGSTRMLEVLPGSWKPAGPEGRSTPAVSEGVHTFTGEIVDSKCYLGVMNPGEGKVHRQCAARCISGGVPAAIAANGGLILLTGPDDRPLSRELSPYAGERVTIRGELIRLGQLQILRADPASITRE
ncbi:MAG: hypothetical protein K2X35_02530 [Bryobacteraceae bacterium]|nr:hypothetical protein [Bryobacteraceae bacterium]